LKKRNLTGTVILLVSLWFFCGCNLTKQLGDNQALLDRNTVKGANKELRSDIKGQIKHKPNRKILGVIKFHLVLYRLGSLGENKFYRFLRKIGEKPVLLDSNQVQASASQIKLFLFNKGYFNAEVKTSTSVFLKRASVTYSVDLDTGYSIRQIAYNISDTAMLRFVKRFMQTGSFLKEGKPFDYDNITRERNRLSDSIRNQGYYFFTKQFLYFNVDSSLGDHEVKITVAVDNFTDSLPHKRYRIRKVYVEIEYPNEDAEHDTVEYDNLLFRMNGYRLNKSILAERIFLRSGRRFRQENLQITYSRLVDLQLFKFINVRFEPLQLDTGGAYLDCFIRLTPQLKHEIVEEPQFITSDQAQPTIDSRNYGIANLVQYRNRNLFRNADLFDLRWRASLESQLSSKNSNVISNAQTSLSASLLVPRLLVLNSLNNAIFKRKLENTSLFSRKQIINTGSNFFLSLNYTKNQNFSQRIISSSFTWQYTRPRVKYFCTPLEINYSKTALDPFFIESLSYDDSVSVTKLFATNITTPFRFSFTYTNRNFTQRRSYVFVRWNALETAGNFLTWYNKSVDPNKIGDYKFLNEKYFQYLKSEIEFTYNTIFDENNSTVFRLNTGIAEPRGNSTVVPFEKRFFIGGANSLRGWRPRVLGPGSYSGSTSSSVQLDRSGEIKLELNGEYRFDITDNLFEGAVYIDAGNVWNIKTDPGAPGGNFDLAKFHNELAVSAGFGLRMNFDFILLRIDPALPISDPREPKGERLVIANIDTEKGWFINNIRVNIGIGYPF
jgi:outer membrane protein assembly factor BamA